MLHRLALRVLPQLNTLVTETSVRKRKRLVMLAPGLVAFGIYRLSKSSLPLDEPLALLMFSGCLAALSALWSYRMGRMAPVSVLVKEDGRARVGWVVGWIGFAYGVQLSLLVLALLKVFVAYDFLLHPEGPAMMAVIIASSSVTRDAFELGYVRWKECQGEHIVTPPNGAPFRRWMTLEPASAGWWAIGSAVISSVGAGLLLMSHALGAHEITQAIVMSLLVGGLGMAAFFAGESRMDRWEDGVRARTWFALARFWLWPCVTFALTYYLVQHGVLAFLIRAGTSQALNYMVMAGTTAALLASYCFYLGRCTLLESETRQGIPENIQSCPFVMGILRKTGVLGQQPAVEPALSAVPSSEKVG